MKIKVYSNTQKSTFRFFTEDGKQICVAFKKPSAVSANTFFHKDYNAVFTKVDGVVKKPDIEKNPDDYEYHKLIRPGEKETVLEAIKKVLKDNLEDVQFVTVVNLPGKKKPTAKKTEEKKAPAKKDKKSEQKLTFTPVNKKENA